MLKLTPISSTKVHNVNSKRNRSLLSSAVATVVSRQQTNAILPMHQLMQHNYIIKTCMTTYTYLTTIVHNKRSAISTFETIVSVVTTESLTNLYASEVMADLKPTKVRLIMLPRKPYTPGRFAMSRAGTLIVECYTHYHFLKYNTSLLELTSSTNL